jgi:hypothetical protein
LLCAFVYILRVGIFLYGGKIFFGGSKFHGPFNQAKLQHDKKKMKIDGYFFSSHSFHVDSLFSTPNEG